MGNLFFLRMSGKSESFNEKLPVIAGKARQSIEWCMVMQEENKL
jgi:hypothetical protein